MADNSELSRLLSSAGLVMLGGIVGASSRLIERVVIGRTLSPEAYGEVSIALAILMFGTTLALAGFGQGIPRYMSRYEDDRDRRGAWLTGLLVTGTLSVLVTVVLLLASATLTETFFRSEASQNLILVFVVAIPFVVALEVAIGAIRGHENTLYRTYAQDLVYPLGRIALLVGLLLAGVDVLAAGLAYLVAAAISSLIAHVLLNRQLPLVGRFRTHTREMVVFSTPLVLSTVLMILLGHTDTLMLGYYVGPYQVGQYEAAYPLASGLLIVLGAFGYLYLPIISRLDVNGRRDEINRLYAATTKWVYIVTFPLFLTFMAFPEDVVLIFFGPQYREAAVVLPILAVGFFVSATVGRNRETLSALGATRMILVANGTGFLLNIGLNVVLIPRYGVVGAAVTSALSFFLVHAVVSGYLKLRYDIAPFTGESVRTFVLLPVVLLPIGVLVSNYVTLTFATLVPFLVVVGIASIVVVSLGGGLQPEDTVAVEFFERLLGERIPLIRRYLPEE